MNFPQRADSYCDSIQLISDLPSVAFNGIQIITERSETTVTTTFIIVLITQKCDLQGEVEDQWKKFLDSDSSP